jgi:glutamine synthetase
MGIDIYDTTTADTSHAFNILLATIKDITAESVNPEPDRGSVSIHRTDGVTVWVSLTYGDDNRYAGVRINSVDSQSKPGSWVVDCAISDLLTFLPAALTVNHL